MQDIIVELEVERDRCRRGLGPLVHFVRSLDDVAIPQFYGRLVNVFLRIYNDPELMGQVEWLMRPESLGGGGPEYLEPRA